MLDRLRARIRRTAAADNDRTRRAKEKLNKRYNVHQPRGPKRSITGRVLVTLVLNVITIILAIIFIIYGGGPLACGIFALMCVFVSFLYWFASFSKPVFFGENTFNRAEAAFVLAWCAWFFNVWALLIMLLNA